MQLTTSGHKRNSRNAISTSTTQLGKQLAAELDHTQQKTSINYLVQLAKRCQCYLIPPFLSTSVNQTLAHFLHQKIRSLLAKVKKKKPSNMIKIYLGLLALKFDLENMCFGAYLHSSAFCSSAGFFSTLSTWFSLSDQATQAINRI